MGHRRFELITLGTGAALPARGRSQSGQVLIVHEVPYLIDCGEGTQERLRSAGISFARLGHAFISHLHGDHYLGLMGLISSLHLLGRTRPFQGHGPAPLKEIIEVQLRASGTYLRYPLLFYALEPESGRVAWQDERVVVRLLALRHRLPCTGFIFEETAAPRPLRKDRLHLVPAHLRARVKAGEDLELPDGTRIANAELTLDPPPVRRYAYCSDTAYAPELVPHLKGVDLLYHEATFTRFLAHRARETQHSTAEDAARMAREASAGLLLLGHFSSRYKSTDQLLAEAQAIFPNTLISQEGGSYPVIEQSAV
ncbi:MAG: ribonuclease Z [Flavobacteriales bacterium]